MDNKFNSPEITKVQPPTIQSSPCVDISIYRQTQQALYTENQQIQYFNNHTSSLEARFTTISEYPTLHTSVENKLKELEIIPWDYEPIKTPFLPPVIDSRGVVYEGQWLTGQRHGRGFMIGPNGRHYFEGEFRSGRRHGQGKCVYIKGKDSNEELIVELGYWEHGNYVGKTNPTPVHQHTHTHTHKDNHDKNHEDTGHKGGCCGH